MLTATILFLAALAPAPEPAGIGVITSGGPSLLIVKPCHACDHIEFGTGQLLFYCGLGGGMASMCLVNSTGCTPLGSCVIEVPAHAEWVPLPWAHHALSARGHQPVEMVESALFPAEQFLWQQDERGAIAAARVLVPDSRVSAYDAIGDDSILIGSSVYLDPDGWAEVAVVYAEAQGDSWLIRSESSSTKAPTACGDLTPKGDYQCKCKDNTHCAAVHQDDTSKVVWFRCGDIVRSERGWIANTADGWVKID